MVFRVFGPRDTRARAGRKNPDRSPGEPGMFYRSVLFVLELFKQVRDLDEIVIVGVLFDSEFVCQNIRV